MGPHCHQAPGPTDWLSTSDDRFWSREGHGAALGADPVIAGPESAIGSPNPTCTGPRYDTLGKSWRFPRMANTVTSWTRSGTRTLPAPVSVHLNLPGATSSSACSTWCSSAPPRDARSARSSSPVCAVSAKPCSSTPCAPQRSARDGAPESSRPAPSRGCGVPSAVPSTWPSANCPTPTRTPSSAPSRPSSRGTRSPAPSRPSAGTPGSTSPPQSDAPTPATSRSTSSNCSPTSVAWRPTWARASPCSSTRCRTSGPPTCQPSAQRPTNSPNRGFRCSSSAPDSPTCPPC